MLKRLSLALLALALVFGGSAQAADIHLGETTLLGSSDSGNANLLLANGPFALTQSATIKSLSLYILNAAGQLRLGIYTSGPNNDCKGGDLQAQTAAFTPGRNKWNTANVISQVALPVGNYCLVFLPSSNSLSFRKGITTGISIAYYPFTFKSMPAQFSSSPSTDPFHWSFYATLTPITVPTLSLSFNPPAPSVPANTPAGTAVAAIVVQWSNGQPFTGSLAFGTPNFSDGGTFAIDGNSNLIVSSTGPGLSGDGGTIQNITAIATQ
jgi:hypothetical protein